MVLPEDARQIKDFSKLDLFSFCKIFLLKYFPRKEQFLESQLSLEEVLKPV